MSQARVRSYRIREFARLAGVTVRALQHYDRMGLLTPARSQAGSRVYLETDLQALVQIVALKSVGIPLRKIGALRANGPSALVETLGTQRRALERKQPVLDRVIFAVRNIEAVLNRGEEADPAVLRPLMDALRNGHGAQQVPEDADVRRRPSWTDLKREWQVLLTDIENAPSADPTSPDMQALAARWERLMSLSTDGVPYTRDLARNLDGLRSGASPRSVPGGLAFDRIGAALTSRLVPQAGGRLVPRCDGKPQA
jgi:DNA-binding transcriptional MerR regulator